MQFWPFSRNSDIFSRNSVYFLQFCYHYWIKKKVNHLFISQFCFSQFLSFFLRNLTFSFLSFLTKLQNSFYILQFCFNSATEFLKTKILFKKKLNCRTFSHRRQFKSHNSVNISKWIVIYKLGIARKNIRIVRLNVTIKFFIFKWRK